MYLCRLHEFPAIILQNLNYVPCTMDSCGQNGQSQALSEVRARREMMRLTLNIIASLLVLGGAIWFLQGINVLPGSFMTGQTRWAVYGAIAIAVGIAFFLRANRRGKS